MPSFQLECEVVARGLFFHQIPPFQKFEIRVGLADLGGRNGCGDLINSHDGVFAAEVCTGVFGNEQYMIEQRSGCAIQNFSLRLTPYFLRPVLTSRFFFLNSQIHQGFAFDAPACAKKHQEDHFRPKDKVGERFLEIKYKI